MARGAGPRSDLGATTAGVALTALTVAPMLLGLAIVAGRYHDFRLGWSWDLAYYNQWLWALTRGDQTLSVRPMAAYGIEGPSVWKMNYLSPLRFLLVPLHLAWPDPRMLLIAHAALFWLVVPASYDLARRESGSRRVGLAAASLVPLVPLMWPLALNDFRELQVAIPWVVVMIGGWRGRDPGRAALGIIAVLACRQEFGLMIASLAIVPPRDPEEVGRTFRWGRWAVVIGLGWFVVGFFGYLYLVLGSQAPRGFIAQFGGPGRAGPGFSRRSPRSWC